MCSRATSPITSRPQFFSKRQRRPINDSDPTGTCGPNELLVSVGVIGQHGCLGSVDLGPLGIISYEYVEAIPVLATVTTTAQANGPISQGTGPSFTGPTGGGLGSGPTGGFGGVVSQATVDGSTQTVAHSQLNTCQLAAVGTFLLRGGIDAIGLIPEAGLLRKLLLDSLGTARAFGGSWPINWERRSYTI